MEVMDEIRHYVSDSEPVQAQKDVTEIPSSSTKQHQKQNNSRDYAKNENKRAETQPSSDSETDEDQEPSQGANVQTRSQSNKSSSSSAATSASGRSIPIGKFRYIPMRLSETERNMLNVLNNALEVCEYTDVVDVTFSHTRKSKHSRIIESLVDILSIASGLMVSNDLLKGEQLLMGKSLNDNVPFFRDLFEIGRRYKIMNPSKMRNTYGKLMYILMDTESYSIKSELKIDFVKPILTVYSFLEEKGVSLDILHDPLWKQASISISSDSSSSCQEMKSKHDLLREQQNKRKAIEELLNKYPSDKLSREDVQRVIDSISDNEAHYEFNAKPVEKMIHLLKNHFQPNSVGDERFSLDLNGSSGGGRGSGLKKAIGGVVSSFYSGYSSSFMGGGGAMLSHNHATQFKFVLQSLTLWKEIMGNLPKLWLCADADMLTEMYRLVDTGQGYQRLQSCPRVRREMSEILRRVQSQVGSWVGLSVVHLGDRDVPNALIFIDKYTQVSRILAPIVHCIEQLESIPEQDGAFHQYVKNEWTDIHGVRMQILSDFFKHGFDGSGDDGGSCIDGRLTSAWNWCSKLHKKPYYYVFMFTGFQGFDGDWKGN